MKWKRHACMLSHFSRVWLFATLWMVASQAPLSMEFSWQEYWSGLPCPPSGEFSWPRDRTCISYNCLHWQVGSLSLAPPGKPKKRPIHISNSPRLNWGGTKSWCITFIYIYIKPQEERGFPGGASGKEPTNLPMLADVRDAGLIPGSGRSPWGGHGNPL